MARSRRDPLDRALEARRRTWTALRAAACGAASVVLLAAVSGAEEARRGASPGDAVDAVVERVLFDVGDGRAIQPTELLEALLPGGPAALDSVLAALRTRGSSEDRSRGQRLDRGRRDALTEALDQLPVLVLRLKLDGALQDDALARAIEIALGVIGATGDDDHLPTAFALAEPRGGERLARPTARAFERALADVLERDPAAHGSLGTRFVRIHPALLTCIVRAVGDVGSRQGLRFFGDALGAFPALDQAILTQIGRTANTSPPPYDWGLLLRIRGYMNDPRPSLRREAAGALGRMEDRESIPELIALLTDSDPGVRANALWALRRVSGRLSGGSPEEWSSWYEAQRTWWREEAPGLIDDVTRHVGAERGKAMRALVLRPLYRHDLAGELADLLETRDASLVAAVCAGLGELRSWVAVPELVELLGHRDDEVRAQAWMALRRITGASLPNDREAWRELLE